MTLFNVTPFELYDEEHDVAVQRHNSNVGIEIHFVYVLGYFSKINKFCCHGALFLKQPLHFMNVR